MNKEQYEKLNKYETELGRAYNCGYARNMTSVARQELRDIYIQLFKSEPVGLLNGCGTCLFNALVRLAKAYFSYKPEPELPATTLADETLDQIPEPDDEPEQPDEPEETEQPEQPEQPDDEPEETEQPDKVDNNETVAKEPVKRGRPKKNEK